MKRSYYYLAVITVLLISVGTRAASTSILYAGQDIPVGNVIISNDVNTLYVVYQTTAPWMMVETHTEAVTEFSDFPMTKKNNPKVGRFSRKATHDPAVYEHTETFDLPAESDILVAAHAVVVKSMECITFDDGNYQEFDQISEVITSSGVVKFRMVEISPLSSLNVNDIASIITTNGYPVLAAPLTSSGPDTYTNIVAFTVNDGGLKDDVVLDANGTWAGGLVLTDPQATNETELLWHAYAQGRATVIDLTDIPSVAGFHIAMIDLDHGEEWFVQYFDVGNMLIYQDVLSEATLGLSSGEGDGVAFSSYLETNSIAKVAIWGRNNGDEPDKLGFAFDDICIMLDSQTEETAWGDGPMFTAPKKRNWATYIEYSVEEDVDSVEDNS